jgi:hypothetical protein
MVNFLYPRTIQVTRPNLDTGVGAQPYGGLLASNETLVASGIAAHIEAERQGKDPDARLPGDAKGESIWRIMFKAALGLVQSDDMITDELGNRYQVISASWEPLGYTCRVQIMQT